MYLKKSSGLSSFFNILNIFNGHLEYTLFSDTATGPAGARRLQLSKWVAFSCSKAVPTGHSLSLVPP
jgi:hypothetical protein